MNIQEIRLSFLSFYEKRLKLQLLNAELRSIRQIAGSVAITDPDRMGHEVSLVSFNLQVLESILADTYSVTATQRDLHLRLSSIRHNARICNAKLQMIWNVAYMPLTNREQLLRDHNQTIRVVAQTLAHECELAVADLEAFLEQER